jgi:hypothetical protein
VIELLKGLLGKMSSKQAAKKSTPIERLKRPYSSEDFRAVKIAPSILCCAAAMQVSGSSYLQREAPRLPLYGCTMPTNCLCKFRKSNDRRDGDRRLLGAGTSRWFAGVENRQQEGRRLAKR